MFVLITTHHFFEIRILGGDTMNLLTSAGIGFGTGIYLGIIFTSIAVDIIEIMKKKRC